jgi:hypothetical protein
VAFSRFSLSAFYRLRLLPFLKPSLVEPNSLQAKSWGRPRRVVAKIEWHRGELFPRIGFVVTSSRLPAGQVIKVYKCRGYVENRIKEGKNTLRWDKTSCQRFEANQARLKIGVLA